MELVKRLRFLSGDYFVEAANTIERLTAELAHMQTMQKVDQRVFEKLRKTQDLAEHWAILAEQRRVELGECRKDAERYRLLRRGQHWSVINGIGDTLRADQLDAAIDAELATHNAKVEGAEHSEAPARTPGSAA